MTSRRILAIQAQTALRKRADKAVRIAWLGGGVSAAGILELVVGFLPWIAIIHLIVGVGILFWTVNELRKLTVLIRRPQTERLHPEIR